MKGIEFKSPTIEVVVLGARAEERDAIIEEFERVAEPVDGSSLLCEFRHGVPVFRIPSEIRVENQRPLISVGVLECAEMGNVASAINTAYAIMRFKPNLVIFSGIAGSLDSRKFRIGDVILPRFVRTRYFQKLKLLNSLEGSSEEYFEAEIISKIGAKLHINDRTVEVVGPARRIISSLDKVKLGRILENIDIPGNWTEDFGVPSRPVSVLAEEESFSWDKVISNKAYVDHLKGRIGNSCTTVDMESYGFLRAVEKLRSDDQTDLPYHASGLVVRAISDFAQHKGMSDSDTKWRRLGLRNMAIATRFLIQNRYLSVF